ncbi:protein kinase domain-containing protein [Sciscionella sediminilitoris]|uniref:protein kinase domain-containing protein n=1 Tax=Sciscionella sediminilitoris TaxID=1445613 RepID=UPI0004DF7D9E|nr:PASTA domain-containing protein [Sciscionella sp. SE31]
MSETEWLGERYRLGEVIGRGGTSEVRHAQDTRLDREVAIKLLRQDLIHDETLRSRFRRRAEHVAVLTHPAIVACYDAGETGAAENESTAGETSAGGEASAAREASATGDEGTAEGTLPYLVLEYVDGRTLRRVLATDGPLPRRRALEIVADVCVALQFAHRNGLGHGALSPAKVMLDKHGAVKVLDFATVSGAGDADVSEDVYAAGALLFELLVGVPPEAGGPPTSWHRLLGPRLDAIVRTALAGNPDERYQSASVLRSALMEVLAETPLPDPARRGSGARPGRELVVVSARRRKPILLGLLGVVVLVGVVWLAGTVFGSSGQERVTLPKLDGKRQPAVTEQLRQLGLVPRRRQVPCQPGADGAPAPCETGQVGTVLRTDPRPGATLGPDSPVTVYVGAPAQRVAVPSDLNGQTPEAASSELNRLGLRAVTAPDRTPVSDPSLIDRVVRADPGAAASLDKGSTVTLTIGAAPPPPSNTPPPGDEKRGENGEGTYVCTPDKLSFAACNPDTLGQIEHYPTYDSG